MQFRYTYPELQPWNYKTTDDYLLSIYNAIAKLYRVTVNDISNTLSNNQDPLGCLVPNRSDQGKDVITHHDYVLDVRYGKCVISPSFRLSLHP